MSQAVTSSITVTRRRLLESAAAGAVAVGLGLRSPYWAAAVTPARDPAIIGSWGGLRIPATGAYFGADDTTRGFTTANGIETQLGRRMGFRNRRYGWLAKCPSARGDRGRQAERAGRRADDVLRVAGQVSRQVLRLVRSGRPEHDLLRSGHRPDHQRRVRLLLAVGRDRVEGARGAGDLPALAGAERTSQSLLRRVAGRPWNGWRGRLRRRLEARLDGVQRREGDAAGGRQLHLGVLRAADEWTVEDRRPVAAVLAGRRRRRLERYGSVPGDIPVRGRQPTGRRQLLPVGGRPPETVHDLRERVPAGKGCDPLVWQVRQGWLGHRPQPDHRYPHGGEAVPAMRGVRNLEQRRGNLADFVDTSAASLTQYRAFASDPWFTLTRS